MIMRRSFHSLLGKPVDLYLSNILVYSSVESVSYLALDMGLPWSAAFFLSAAGARLSLEPLGAILRRVQWKLPKKVEGVLSDVHKNCFLNDLKADVSRLQLPESTHLSLASTVSPAALLSQSVQAYLLLSFFRGIHHLCDSPLYYPGLSPSPFLWLPDITQFDPFFLSPILFGLLNYVALQRGNHAMLLPFDTRKKAVLAFLSALGGVLLPGAYLVSWSGVVCSHLLIQAVKGGLGK